MEQVSVQRLHPARSLPGTRLVVTPLADNSPAYPPAPSCATEIFLCSPSPSSSTRLRSLVQKPEGRSQRLRSVIGLANSKQDSSSSSSVVKSSASPAKSRGGVAPPCPRQSVALGNERPPERRPALASSGLRPLASASLACAASPPSALAHSSLTGPARAVDVECRAAGAGGRVQVDFAAAPKHSAPFPACSALSETARAPPRAAPAGEAQADGKAAQSLLARSRPTREAADAPRESKAVKKGPVSLAQRYPRHAIPLEEVERRRRSRERRAEGRLDSFSSEPTEESSREIPALTEFLHASPTREPEERGKTHTDVSLPPSAWALEAAHEAYREELRRRARLTREARQADPEEETRRFVREVLQRECEFFSSAHTPRTRRRNSTHRQESPSVDALPHPPVFTARVPEATSEGEASRAEGPEDAEDEESPPPAEPEMSPEECLYVPRSRLCMPLGTLDSLPSSPADTRRRYTSPTKPGEEPLREETRQGADGKETSGRRASVLSLRDDLQGDALNEQDVQDKHTTKLKAARQGRGFDREDLDPRIDARFPRPRAGGRSRAHSKSPVRDSALAASSTLAAAPAHLRGLAPRVAPPQSSFRSPAFSAEAGGLARPRSVEGERLGGLVTGLPTAAWEQPAGSTSLRLLAREAEATGSRERIPQPRAGAGDSVESQGVEATKLRKARSAMIPAYCYLVQSREGARRPPVPAASPLSFGPPPSAVRGDSGTSPLSVRESRQRRAAPFLSPLCPSFAAASPTRAPPSLEAEPVRTPKLLPSRLPSSVFSVATDRARASPRAAVGFGLGSADTSEGGGHGATPSLATTIFGGAARPQKTLRDESRERIQRQTALRLAEENLALQERHKRLSEEASRTARLEASAREARTRAKNYSLLYRDQQKKARELQDTVDAMVAELQMARAELVTARDSLHEQAASQRHLEESWVSRGAESGHGATGGRRLSSLRASRSSSRSSRARLVERETSEDDVPVPWALRQSKLRGNLQAEDSAGSVTFRPDPSPPAQRPPRARLLSLTPTVPSAPPSPLRRGSPSGCASPSLRRPSLSHPSGRRLSSPRFGASCEADDAASRRREARLHGWRGDECADFAGRDDGRNCRRSDDEDFVVRSRPPVEAPYVLSPHSPRERSGPRPAAAADLCVTGETFDFLPFSASPRSLSSASPPAPPRDMYPGDGEELVAQGRHVGFLGDPDDPRDDGVRRRRCRGFDRDDSAHASLSSSDVGELLQTLTGVGELLKPLAQAAGRHDDRGVSPALDVPAVLEKLRASRHLHPALDRLYKDLYSLYFPHGGEAGRGRGEPLFAEEEAARRREPRERPTEEEILISSFNPFAEREREVELGPGARVSSGRKGDEKRRREQETLLTQRLRKSYEELWLNVRMRQDIDADAKEEERRKKQMRKQKKKEMKRRAADGLRIGVEFHPSGLTETTRRGHGDESDASEGRPKLAWKDAAVVSGASVLRFAAPPVPLPTEIKAKHESSDSDFSSLPSEASPRRGNRVSLRHASHPGCTSSVSPSRTPINTEHRSFLSHSRRGASSSASPPSRVSACPSVYGSSPSSRRPVSSLCSAPASRVALSATRLSTRESSRRHETGEKREEKSAFGMFDPARFQENLEHVSRRNRRRGSHSTSDGDSRQATRGSRARTPARWAPVGAFYERTPKQAQLGDFEEAKEFRWGPRSYSSSEEERARRHDKEKRTRKKEKERRREERLSRHQERHRRGERRHRHHFSPTHRHGSRSSREREHRRERHWSSRRRDSSSEYERKGRRASSYSSASPDRARAPPAARARKDGPLKAPSSPAGAGAAPQRSSAPSAADAKADKDSPLGPPPSKAAKAKGLASKAGCSSLKAVEASPSSAAAQGTSPVSDKSRVEVLEDSEGKAKAAASTKKEGEGAAKPQVKKEENGGKDTGAAAAKSAEKTEVKAAAAADEKKIDGGDSGEKPPPGKGTGKKAPPPPKVGIVRLNTIYGKHEDDAGEKDAKVGSVTPEGKAAPAEADEARKDAGEALRKAEKDAQCAKNGKTEEDRANGGEEKKQVEGAKSAAPKKDGGEKAKESDAAKKEEASKASGDKKAKADKPKESSPEAAAASDKKEEGPRKKPSNGARPLLAAGENVLSPSKSLCFAMKQQQPSPQSGVLCKSAQGVQVVVSPEGQGEAAASKTDSKMPPKADSAGTAPSGGPMTEEAKKRKLQELRRLLRKHKGLRLPRLGRKGKKIRDPTMHDTFSTDAVQNIVEDLAAAGLWDPSGMDYSVADLLEAEDDEEEAESPRQPPPSLLKRGSGGAASRGELEA
ncbi:hypothetical protein BESB_054800 [Besnoitia besnoiti]|uniref:Uncharacterized protein n=1 Tax=Besnoitia besnoiti TaxID=94643 RepID=A0A2A9MD72_BESBE|nr:hypothetical protein BESB_054800 [Besnoitia besnoiti]PFH35829.1 hypothetical protein BESB_054800 [Besnoitia besnoiti]